MRIAHSPTLVRLSVRRVPGVRSSNGPGLTTRGARRGTDPRLGPCGLAKRVRRTTRRRADRGRIRTRTSPTIVTPLVLESPRERVDAKEGLVFHLEGPAATSVSGAGTVAAGPIVVNGVVYIQDLHSNVYALSLATGKLEWQYIVNKKELSGRDPTAWRSPTAWSTRRRRPRSLPSTPRAVT